MPLSSDQKKKLEKLSIDQEGVAFVGQRAKATTYPTIVMSLGGLGGEALGQLKKKFVKEVGNASHVHFLAIDTCDDDLSKRKISASEDGTLEDSETISVYELGIQNILRHDHRPAYLRKWLSDEFPEIRLDANGAQGRRQIGRVMLVCGRAYDRIKEKLSSYIDQASRESGAVPHFEVILIAGVSGGTGSGSIIDVSYLVHRVMKDSNITDYGFGAYVFTPDVQFNVKGIKGNDSVLSNLKKNGYAALKEIDYFMNLSNHGGVYELDRGTSFWSCDKNIFTSCTIVSGIAEMGGMITKEATIKNLTESLLDSLTDVEMKGDDGSDIQMARAFSSNRRENLDSWYRNEGRDPVAFPRATNYVYQILGYSAVSIPKNEILAYCVNRMFQAVTAEFNSIENVDRDTVNTVLSHAQLSDHGEYAQYALGLNPNDPIQTRISLPQNLWPSKRDVANGTDETLDMAKGIAQDEANKVISKTWQAKLKNALLNQLNHDIDAIFEKSGPYFVVELLTHYLDKPMGPADPRQPFSGILERFRMLRDELVERANTNRGFTMTQSFMVNKQQLAQQASGVFAGKDKMSNYVDYCCMGAVNEILVPTFYDVLADVLVDVANELTDTNNKIWSVYTDVLTEVGHILEKDAQAVTDPQKHGNTYSFNVLNLYEVNSKTEKLRKYLDDFVSPKSVSDLCDAFITSMRDKRDEWTEMSSNQNFDVVKEVRDIFNNCLNSVLKTDVVEKFVVAAYSPNQLSPQDIDRIWAENGPEKQTALVAAAREIVQVLKTRGGLMARLDGVADTAFGQKHIVATLFDTPSLSKAILAQYNDPSITPAISKGLTKYFTSKLVFNLPLCHISGFQDYDQAYRENSDRLGLHMSESDDPTKGLDWRRLPQPFIIDVAARREKDYKDFYDYQVLMEVKEQADLALDKYHFIYKKNKDSNWFVLRDVVKQPDNLDAFRTKAQELLQEDEEAVITDDLLSGSGFGFHEIALTMEEHDLIPTDLKGDQSVVKIGDFYKLIRMSVRYMDLLSRNLKIYEDLYKTFEDVRKVVLERSAYSRNMLIFTNALKAKLIKEEQPNIWSFTVRDNKQILVDLRADSRFDKDYVLYHAFTAFCKLADVYRAELRKKAKALLTGEEDVQDLKEKVDTILGEDFLGDMFAKEDVIEDAKGSELDYSFTDDPENAKTSYQVLLRYYKLLKRQLR